MSASNIISPANNKIFNRYLPNPYPYPAFPSPLGAVLIAGNQAGDQDIVGVDNLQVTKVDNPLLGGSLTIGGAGQDLRITGATTKGSVLAGNGTSTVELPLGATGYVLKSNPATATGLEWAIDISGVTGVVGVNAGANIDISGTVSQPIVSLQSPLTSTLNMGAVALQDISGATGTSGQFLSAGAGGQAKWATPAYPVVSVVGGTNIDVSGTTTSTVSLKNPLTAQLNLGSQQLVGLSGVHGITLDGLGVVLDDTTAPTSIITNTVRDSEIIILTADGPSGQFDRTTLNNTTLTLEQQDLTVPTLTKTAIYGNCSTSEVINNTTTTETSSHTTTNTANSVDENFTITGGSGESLALFNLKSTGGGSDYQTLYTASTGDASQQRQIVSGGGSVLLEQFTTTGVVTSNNIQTNAVQTIQSMSYTSTPATTNVGIEADSTRTRIRCLYNTPNSGVIDTGTSIITDSAGCSLTQSYTQAGNNVTTTMATANTGCNLSTTAGAFNVSGPQVGVTATTNMFLTAGNRNAMSVGGNTRLDLESVNTILTNPAGSGGGTTTILGSGVVGKPALILSNQPSNLANNPTTLEMYYNKSIAGATGDIVTAINFYGEDASTNKIQLGGIESVLTQANPAVGTGPDGAMDFYTNVNGTKSLVWRLNGADNENNSFRPIDMNGQDVKTSSGNLSIGNASSSLAGSVLTIATKDATAGSGAGLALTGNTLLSPTSGGNAGQHLCLTIGGTVYKIQLLNP